MENVEGGQAARKQVTWKKRAAIIGIFLLAIIAVIAINQSSKSSEAKEQERIAEQWAQAADDAEASKQACLDRGYDSEYHGVCWKWMDHNDSRFKCDYTSGVCSVVEISPNTACDSIYVQANVLDGADNILDWTNGTARSVPAEGNAVITLSSFEDNAKSFKLTELTCN